MSDVRSTIAPEDKRFILSDKEVKKDFSPERNKFLIEESIRKYEEKRKQKMKEHDEEYAERSDAVVTYLKSLDRGGSNSNMEKYFGKRTLAYLRGQEIREKLMAGMTFMTPDGQIIKKGI